MNNCGCNREDSKNLTQRDGLLKRTARKYRWTLIFLVIMTVSFGMGFYGYSKTISGFGFDDSLYSTFRLFVMEWDAPGGVTLSPWLNVARFVSFASFFLMTVSAIVATWMSTLETFLCYREHAIVCGLGTKGELLAKAIIDLVENGNPRNKIVVIEQYADNPEINEFRARGIPVIIGDATDIGMLEKAGASRASKVYAMTGDDVANLETAFSLEKLSARTGKSDKPICYVHLHYPQTYEVFSNLLQTRQNTIPIKVTNSLQDGARILIDAKAPDRLYRYMTERVGSEPILHIMIIGFGNMGESLLRQLLKVAHYNLSKGKVKITIIDKDISGVRSRFCKGLTGNENCNMDLLQDFIFCFVETDINMVASLEELGIENDDLPCVAYISLGDDRVGIAAATKLRSLFINRELLKYKGREIPGNFNDEYPHIVVYMQSPDFSTHFDKCCKNDPGISVVSIHREAMAALAKGNNKQEKVAKMFHALYVTECPNWGNAVEIKKELSKIQGYESKTLEAKADGILDLMKRHSTDSDLGREVDMLKREFPAMRSWNDLSESDRDSNKSLADHLEVKLRCIAIDKSLEKCGESEIRAIEKAIESLTTRETLATLEHRRWATERLLSGWQRWHKKVDWLKLHHDLVPFAKLIEKEKKKDDSFILNIPRICREYRDWPKTNSADK